MPQSIDAALAQPGAVLPNLVRELRDQASLEPAPSELEQAVAGL